jgi:hypothetical protein
VIYPWKMVIFHSYVSLPEGNSWVETLHFPAKIQVPMKIAMVEKNPDDFDTPKSYCGLYYVRHDDPYHHHYTWPSIHIYIYVSIRICIYIYTHNQYSPLSLSEGIVPTIPKILSIYTPVPFFIIIFHLPIKMVVSEWPYPFCNPISYDIFSISS